MKKNDKWLATLYLAFAKTAQAQTQLDDALLAAFIEGKATAKERELVLCALNQNHELMQIWLDIDQARQAQLSSAKPSARKFSSIIAWLLPIRGISALATVVLVGFLSIRLFEDAQPDLAPASEFVPSIITEESSDRALEDQSDNDALLNKSLERQQEYKQEKSSPALKVAPKPSAGLSAPTANTITNTAMSGVDDANTLFSWQPNNLIHISILNSVKLYVSKPIQQINAVTNLNDQSNITALFRLEDKHHIGLITEEEWRGLLTPAQPSLSIRFNLIDENQQIVQFDTRIELMP